MANLNTGSPIRFPNGGVILIGADTLINLAENAGELSVRPGMREGRLHFDRGTMTHINAGNERPTEWRLRVKVVASTMADASASLLSKFVGAYATNKIVNLDGSGGLFKFNMTIKIPDNLQATTGQQIALANCWVNEPPEYVPGEEYDVLALAGLALESSPTFTRY